MNLPASQITAYTDKISQAALRIAPYIRQTPLLEAPLLNQLLGARILFKAENLQITGSFKLRGALNKMLQLKAEKQERIVAFSTGNHAQAVAYGAQMLGMDAKILIPQHAPSLKIANSKAYGAEIILFDPHSQDREKLTQEIARRENRAIIKPFDDEAIIVGQGTLGKEIQQQLNSANEQIDSIIIPCGGGGLCAGTALAMQEKSPHVNIYTAEPENFDDTARSLALGERVPNPQGKTTLCDAIVTLIPGVMTFAINQHLIKAGLAASDEDVIEAMELCFTHLKLVVEPGGAIGLACLLQRLRAQDENFLNKRIVIVLSGGNIPLASFQQFLA